MQKLFVPYEIAKQLKEKGFDEPCFGYFSSKKEDKKVTDKNSVISYSSYGYFYKNNQNENDVCSPLYQQVIDWLATKHGIDIVVSPIKGESGNELRSYTATIFTDKMDGKGIITIPMKHLDGKREVITKWINTKNAYDAAILESLKLI